MDISYPFSIDDLIIVLYKKISFDELPFYKITVTGKGDVTYEGYFEQISIHKGSILPAEVLKLFKFAVEIDFFQMSEEFDKHSRLVINDKEIDCIVNDYDIKECPYSNITIATGKNVKNVCYGAYTCSRFQTFVNRIIKAADAKKWIEKEDIYFKEAILFKEIVSRAFDDPYFDN